MNEFANDSGELIDITAMDKWRLVHSLAKYAVIASLNDPLKVRYENVVENLKKEIIRRIKETP